MDQDNLKEFARSEYWDRRYGRQPKDSHGMDSKEIETYEWFRRFQDLQRFFSRHLPAPTKDPKLLHLGCGDSSLTADLYRLGYRNEVSVDFSAVVIEKMRARYRNLQTRWEVMDIRDLKFSDKVFDIAIDKGTLDSFLHGSLWAPPPEVKENVRVYVNEVLRVLKPGGKWLYITYRQPHFMKPMLLREGFWTVKVESLSDEPGGRGMFEYFGYIMEKR